MAPDFPDTEADDTGLIAPSVVEPVALEVLSYANLRGQQPSDSRFVCVISSDGVTLTEEPLPNLGRGHWIAGAFFLLIGALAGAIVGDEIFNEFHRERAVLFELLFPLFLLICGATAWMQGHLYKTVGTRLEVSGGYLRVFAPLILARHRRWRITPALKLHVPMGSPGFVRGRGVSWMSHVMVQKRSIGLRTTILLNRPKDECEWIVRELTSAMDRCRAARDLPDTAR